MEVVSDFVGTTTMDKVDKWQETGLTTLPASEVSAPLLAQCPVTIECRVLEKVSLPSHTLFIAQVAALHADPAVLNERNEVDFRKAQGGLPYRAGVVRERPVANFQPEELLKQVRRWCSGRPLE